MRVWRPRCARCQRWGHAREACTQPENAAPLTKLLWVKLTEEQHAGVKALAKAERVPATQLLRDLLMERLAKP